ncbi:MAG: MBL fold metallo-hydrolase [Clostridia bacterium]|nr:MBL fold metallo-hydrolase [Clostridia bacterium]
MNLERTRDGAPKVFTHVMYIPTNDQHFGHYYALYDNGDIKDIRIYDGYYFTSAEYYRPYVENPDPGSVDAVVVSHFHGDHCSDLTVYDYYLSHTGKKIDLYAPDGDGAFIRKHNNFIHKVTYDGYSVHIGEATVWFFKTCHPAYCLGVRVEFGGKVFVYSADTSECENLDKALEGADLCVLDCAFQKEQYRVGGPHLSADICGNYAKKYNVKTLLSHLPPEGDTQTLLRQAKECSALCELIDFKTYTV